MGTMTPSEIERFVEEVVHYAPDVGVYTSVLKRIVERLVAADFVVSTRFDTPVSSVTRHLDGTAGGHVRLYPKVGLNCLWDLAHEAGHLDEPTAEADAVEQLRREEAAWDAGWGLLVSEDPSIASSQAAYERRRDDCLEGYRKAAIHQRTGGR